MARAILRISMEMLRVMIPLPKGTKILDARGRINGRDFVRQSPRDTLGNTIDLLVEHDDIAPITSPPASVGNLQVVHPIFRNYNYGRREFGEWGPADVRGDRWTQEVSEIEDVK